jgi:glycosyltransferase involved in cell wall biosynthesis
VIQSDVSGFLADPRDEEAMASWAIRLLGDRGRWESVSMAARDRAVTEFEQGAVVQRYLDYYERILSR